MRLALSEHGLIQLYHLFAAAEKRSESRHRELLEQGDHESAARETERQKDYADMKQRILQALRGRRPPSRMETILQLLRSLFAPSSPQRPTVMRPWR